MIYKIRVAAAALMIVALVFACSVTAAGYMLGDVDNDENVTIIDASCVQRKLAGLRVSGFSESAADVDSSGTIEIIDATYIQRFQAGIDTPYPIGVQSTAAPTQKPTQPRPTDDGWGHEIYQP